MAEAQVEVSYSDWYDDDDTMPWCVDDGSAIVVLRTREIFARVDDGRLPLDTKVWRDGRACWLPICECYELTVKPPPCIVLDEGDDELPEISGVRRVTSPVPLLREIPPSSAELWRRGAVIVTASLLCGVLLGLLALWPYEAPAERLDATLGRR